VCGQLLSALPASIHDRDPCCPRQGEFHGDRSRGAAGAENQSFPAGSRHDFLKGAQEPLAVRVLADESALTVADDAVHRADQAGRLAQLVEVFDDGHLVGQRTVEAGPPHGVGAGHGGRETLGWHFAVDVPPVEAVMAECGFDHLDGWVLGGRIGQGTDDFRQEVHGRQVR